MKGIYFGVCVICILFQDGTKFVVKNVFRLLSYVKIDPHCNQIMPKWKYYIKKQNCTNILESMDIPQS